MELFLIYFVLFHEKGKLEGVNILKERCIYAPFCSEE